MHTLVAPFDKVENFNSTDERSDAPSGSTYCAENSCDAEEPAFGVTGPASSPPPADGIVQVPRCCKFVVAPATFNALRYVFFAPAYAPVKIIATFIVRFCPLTDTELP